MTEQKEKVFADGLISKRNENAPDFVIINQSYKVEEFIKFLQANAKNGWVKPKQKLLSLESIILNLIHSSLNLNKQVNP